MQPSPNPARILVVEDEGSIRQGLCDVLTYRGYAVEAVDNGVDAVAATVRSRFDLLLLDVMLPGLDGYSVCRTVREAGEQASILMLTAKGAEDDVLRGFEAGADDYVTKPFSVRELLARVSVLLKRHHRLLDGIFQAAPLEVHPELGLAFHGSEEIALSLREIGILRLLAEEPGRIIGRRTLLREVWNMNNPELVETRTVDVHIAKLRKKLGDVGSRSLQTVRGHGYRWRA